MTGAVRTTDSHARASGRRGADGLYPAGCILCEGSAATVRFSYSTPDAYEQTVGIHEADYARAWVCCNSCGFHYSRFTRDAEVLHRIYDDDYRRASHSFRSATPEETFRKIVALPFEQSETRQRIAAIVESLAQLRDQDILARATPTTTPRLLDIGGGNGIFAHLFKEAAPDWRVEIADPATQGRFVERYGITYHTKSFDADFDEGRFDLVSLNYVLEHAADPRRMMQSVAKCLRPSGVAYVEVPDEIAFLRRPPEDDIFNACHLWMFGPSSLQTLMASTGFEVLWLRRGLSPRGHFFLSALVWPSEPGP